MRGWLVGGAFLPTKPSGWLLGADLVDKYEGKEFRAPKLSDPSQVCVIKDVNLHPIARVFAFLLCPLVSHCLTYV